MRRSGKPTDEHGEESGEASTATAAAAKLRSMLGEVRGNVVRRAEHRAGMVARSRCPFAISKDCSRLRAGEEGAPWSGWSRREARLAEHAWSDLAQFEARRTV